MIKYKVKVQKNNFKNSIISAILIMSTVSMPFAFYPKKAQAQMTGAYGGISGYAAGLGPAIAALPQCNIFGGIKDLFSSDITTNTVSSTNGLGLGNISKFGALGDPNKFGALGDVSKLGFNKTLNDTAASAASQINSISVNLPSETEKKLSDIQINTAQTKSATESMNANSTCIQSIGRLIIKMLLQKLTKSTVEWINNGFNGSPSFIQDPGKFFGDIARTEVLQMGVEINAINSPFGKEWMRNTAAAFNNKFQDNARYSLNQMIQDTDPAYSAATFQEDFSQGGWNAWTAMTQVPANNPLGFKLLADNELQKRLAGTTESTAQYVHEALSQANGFLGDNRCVDSQGSLMNITQQQRTNALNATRQDPCIAAGGTWKYVTPGYMVASAATNVMGYQNNAYLNAQDLNDAVAAMIDALLGQFSQNIFDKGFVNIGNEGADGTLITSTMDLGSAITTQTEKDFMPSQLSSSWLQANPDFNIRTDLTQALIDEQRTYSNKLTNQNKELMSTVDGKPYAIDPTTGISNAWGLMPAIYQLDYCVPGPHPGWETDSQKALAAGLSKVVPETVNSTKDKNMSAVVGGAKSILQLSGFAVGTFVLGPLAATAIGLTAGSAMFPVVGTVVGAIVGAIVGALVSLLSGSDEAANVRAYYATIIGGFTGYTPPSDNKNDDRALNLESKSGLTYVLNSILDRYSTIMNQVYNSDTLPPVTSEAATNFDQLTGYYQMMKDNTDEISTLKNVIGTLEDIKAVVDDLNSKLESGQITKDDYETQLKVQINAFGRISASMVNGDDIAKADNILKQIKDKRVYIYNNLLKGPYGCEKELETPKNFPFPHDITENLGEGFADKNKTGQGLAGYGKMFTEGRWDRNNTAAIKRMTYPFPIIYDYNVLKKESNIPDPWNSGFTNKMPNADTNLVSGQPSFYDSNGNLIMGPGFLSFIYFTAGGSGDSDAYTYRGPERLKTWDLVPQSGVGQWISVGERSSGHEGSSPFEHMIGIY